MLGLGWVGLGILENLRRFSEILRNFSEILRHGMSLIDGALHRFFDGHYIFFSS